VVKAIIGGAWLWQAKHDRLARCPSAPLASNGSAFSTAFRIASGDGDGSSAQAARVSKQTAAATVQQITVVRFMVVLQTMLA
jgi:hypothetical protein